MKKSILPWVLITLGATTLVFPLAMTAVVLVFDDSLSLHMLPIGAAYGVCLVQIVYGINLLKKQKIQRNRVIFLIVLGILTSLAVVPAVLFLRT